MTIDSSLRPEWIARRDQRKAEAVRRAESAAMQERLAELLIEKHSAQFCLDFLRGLQFNFDCLNDISGTVESGATPNTGPQFYTVGVRGSAPNWRSVTATIQFSKPNTSGIHVLVFGGEAKCIPLAPLPTGDGVGAIWHGRMTPIDANSLAELVVEEWVNHVCPLP